MQLLQARTTSPSCNSGTACCGPRGSCWSCSPCRPPGPRTAPCRRTLCTACHGHRGSHCPRSSCRPRAIAQHRAGARSAQRFVAIAAVAAHAALAAHAIARRTVQAHALHSLFKSGTTPAGIILNGKLVFGVTTSTQVYEKLSPSVCRIEITATVAKPRRSAAGSRAPQRRP